MSRKRIVASIGILIMAVFVFSCKGKEDAVYERKDLYNFEENVSGKRIAVAYFSLDDDTDEVAEKFKEAIDADIIKIEPAKAYTEEDLNYADKNSRVYLEDEYNPFGGIGVDIEDEYETSEGIIIETKESEEVQAKITELPGIKSNSANRYNIIVLGFPVWYENAPKVIYTFVKGLKDKVVVPFCTDGEMGQIDQFLSNIADDSVQMMRGKSFDKDVSVEEIKEWVTYLSADFDF